MDTSTKDKLGFTELAPSRLSGWNTSDLDGGGAFNTTADEYLQTVNREFALQVLPAVVVLLIVMVVGALGNLVVLYVYSCRSKRGTITRFIQTLAVFDLLSCCLAIPGEIMDMTNNYTFGSYQLCKVMRTANLFCSVASGATLVVVAIDRYKRICYPMRRQISQRGALIILSCCTLASLLVSLPTATIYGGKTVATGWALVNGTDCSISDRFSGTLVPLAYNSLQMLLFLVGASTLVIIYSLVGSKVCTHVHEQQIRRKSFSLGRSRFSPGHTSMLLSCSTNMDNHCRVESHIYNPASRESPTEKCKITETIQEVHFNITTDITDNLKEKSGHITSKDTPATVDDSVPNNNQGQHNGTDLTKSSSEFGDKSCCRTDLTKSRSESGDKSCCWTDLTKSRSESEDKSCCWTDLTKSRSESEDKSCCWTDLTKSRSEFEDKSCCWTDLTKSRSESEDKSCCWTDLTKSRSESEDTSCCWTDLTKSRSESEDTSCCWTDLTKSRSESEDKSCCWTDLTKSRSESDDKSSCCCPCVKGDQLTGVTNSVSKKESQVGTGMGLPRIENSLVVMNGPNITNYEAGTGMNVSHVMNSEVEKAINVKDSDVTITININDIKTEVTQATNSTVGTMTDLLQMKNSEIETIMNAPQKKNSKDIIMIHAPQIRNSHICLYSAQDGYVGKSTNEADIQANGANIGCNYLKHVPQVSITNATACRNASLITSKCEENFQQTSVDVSHSTEALVTRTIMTNVQKSRDVRQSLSESSCQSNCTNPETSLRYQSRSSKHYETTSHPVTQTENLVQSSQDLLKTVDTGANCRDGKDSSLYPKRGPETTIKADSNNLPKSSLLSSPDHCGDDSKQERTNGLGIKTDSNNLTKSSLLSSPDHCGNDSKQERTNSLGIKTDSNNLTKSSLLGSPDHCGNDSKQERTNSLGIYTGNSPAKYKQEERTGCEKQYNITSHDSLLRRNVKKQRQGSLSLKHRITSGFVKETWLVGGRDLKNSSVADGNPYTLGADERDNKRENLQPNGTKRVTLMLFIITIVYVLSFLPHLVLMAIKALDEDSLRGLGSSWELAENLLIRSYFINSMANPVIYSFFSKNFFTECKKSVSCCRSKNF